MSQPLITNGSVNAIDPTNTKDINELDGVKKEIPVQTQACQPNVRHIPIFVEGRDEPLFNKNLDTTTVDAPISSRPAPVLNDSSQPGSIFNRVKDIPVKKVPEFQPSNIGRSGSPARTIPINVIHTQTNKTSSGAQHHPSQQTTHQQTQPRPQQQQQQQTQPGPQEQQQQQTQQLHPQQPDRRSQSPKPTPIDPITKIQNIQKEILELMNRVEKFKGGSRKDKEYIYLDEMLTQNLLKLDTIDTEGKENIKAARKEAIHCINKCIQVLEAKTESADKFQTENPSRESASQGSRHEGNLKQYSAQGCTQDNKQCVDSQSNNSNNETTEVNAPFRGSST